MSSDGSTSPIDSSYSAMRIQPYSSEVYNTAIPTFKASSRRFQEEGGQAAVNTVIRDCFIKHGVEKNFAACIIHKHYDLKPDERNIEQDGRAIASSDLRNIHPISWVYYQKQCYPYEFQRSNIPGFSVQPKPEFVEEYGEILEKARLAHILGFQRYVDGEVGVEQTKDNISVTVTVEESKVVPDENYKPASFAFIRD